ncbi:MAG TPA: ankyrin repeat domain-containing protein [Bryobacteraceae bacterium]|nr:ankyrin repeat domain-containing protein [Bryobacteraceae bacterium]
MQRPTLAILAFLMAGCGMQPENPLVGPARSGDAHSIRTLLAQGADPNQTWGVNGWTPLMHAVHKNQKASVEALLAGGADVNARGGKGITALMMAAGYGYADTVQVLLKHGADPYAETSDGDSALAAAVSGVPDIDKFTVGHCQIETVRALLAKAPDLKLKDNFYGRAARMAASAAGCGDVLALIDRKRPSAEHSNRGQV